MQLNKENKVKPKKEWKNDRAVIVNADFNHSPGDVDGDVGSEPARQAYCQRQIR